MRRFGPAVLVAALLLAGAASAAETITYKYDAQGRLVKVERSGTVNNGKQTTYVHDKANNRQTKTTQGEAVWGAFTWGSANWGG